MRLSLTAMILALEVMARGQSPSPLAAMSTEIRALTERASQAVVEIQVTSLGAASPEGAVGVVTRQQGLGSGVIVDPDGYIVTNAHVVAGAIDTKVLLNRPSPDGDLDPSPSVDARILGVDRESDLALLKVDLRGLAVLPFAPMASLRQGDIVLAIGNPMGLRNSVSMGVVSATSRSIGEDNPLSYIQTDASINPGNSGGALVDTSGNLVGINTFIFSRSGGFEGLGFAIPSHIVQQVLTQLRQKGHVDRGEAGVVLQDITPAIKEGLSLGRARGALVADVEPDSPADKAGLQIGDIVTAIDGQPVDSVARFRSYGYFRQPGQDLVVDYRRGDTRANATIKLRQRRAHFDPLEAIGTPEEHLIPRLGVLGVEIDRALAQQMPVLRKEGGILVAARAVEGLGQFLDIQAGDVIHALNGVPVVSLDYLKGKVAEMKPGTSVALQIEREGQMQYVGFTIQ